MRSIQTPLELSSDQQPAELQISRAILPGVGSGIDLPEGTSGLSLWANPGQPRARLGIGARIRDSRGYTFDALIGEPSEAGWQKVSGELQPRPTRGSRQPIAVEPPFTLVNLQVFSRFGLSDPGRGFYGRSHRHHSPGRSFHR